MNVSEIRSRTIDELQGLEVDLAEQLFALRMKKVTGQLENPLRIREVRRELARVLTILREKTAASA